MGWKSEPPNYADWKKMFLATARQDGLRYSCCAAEVPCPAIRSIKYMHKGKPQYWRVRSDTDKNKKGWIQFIRLHPDGTPCLYLMLDHRRDGGLLIPEKDIVWVKSHREAAV